MMWPGRRWRRCRRISTPRLNWSRLTREYDLSLTGPDALLKQLTKSVIETALSEEMTDHLGYEKPDPAGIGSVNNSDSLDHP